MLSLAAQDQDVAAVMEWIDALTPDEFHAYAALVLTRDVAALRAMPCPVLHNVLALADVGLFEVGERTRAIDELEAR